MGIVLRTLEHESGYEGYAEPEKRAFEISNLRDKERRYEPE